VLEGGPPAFEKKERCPPQVLARTVQTSSLAIECGARASGEGGAGAV
jgi:hypothetical protein